MLCYLMLKLFVFFYVVLKYSMLFYTARICSIIYPSKWKVKFIVNNHHVAWRLNVILSYFILLCYVIIWYCFNGIYFIWYFLLSFNLLFIICIRINLYLWKLFVFVKVVNSYEDLWRVVRPYTLLPPYTDFFGMVRIQCSCYFPCYAIMLLCYYVVSYN